MEIDSFDKFQSGIVTSARRWHRVNNKMMWVYQPGEVVFLLQLVKPKAMKYFDIYLFYGHRDWIKGSDYEALTCGALAPYRKLVRKHDLHLLTRYPGTEENFYGALFDSLLATDNITRNRRSKFPEMMDLSLRQEDWSQFFDLLQHRLKPLRTLSDIEKTFGGQLNAEFWERMKSRVKNYPSCG